MPAELNNTANQNPIRRAAIQADPNLPVRKTNGGRGGKRDTGDTLSASDMQQGPHIKIGREVRFDHLPGRLSTKAFRTANRLYVNSLTKKVTIIQSVRTTKSEKNAVTREIDAVGDSLASRRYAEMVASGWKVNVNLVEAGTGRLIPFAHNLTYITIAQGVVFWAIHDDNFYPNHYLVNSH